MDKKDKDKQKTPGPSTSVNKKDKHKQETPGPSTPVDKKDKHKQETPGPSTSVDKEEKVEKLTDQDQLNVVCKGIETALRQYITNAQEIPAEQLSNNLFSELGSFLPSDVKNRLEETWGLANKVSALEKRVLRQKKEILSLYDEREALRGEVDTLNEYKKYEKLPVGKLIMQLSEKSKELSAINSKFSTLDLENSGLKAALAISEHKITEMKAAFATLEKENLEVKASLVALQQQENSDGKAALTSEFSCSSSSKESTGTLRVPYTPLNYDPPSLVTLYHTENPPTVDSEIDVEGRMPGSSSGKTPVKKETKKRDQPTALLLSKVKSSEQLEQPPK